MTAWRLPLLLALLLGAAVAALYWPATGFDFVNYDDLAFVRDNLLVTGGLRAEGLSEAFTTTRYRVYLPLTLASLMADVSLQGDSPRGFHRTNILLFALACSLLPLVLWRLTGALGASVLAAALFAFHPMRAESVAWITERKDCLVLLFAVLALGCYERFARTGGRRWMIAVALLFLCGVLSKPVLLTLPLLLLLLDYWPLGRVGRAGRPTWAEARPLLREKLPLFAISAAFAALVLVMGESLSAGWPGASAALGRIENAVVSPLIYLGKTLWPAGLGVRHFDAAAGFDPARLLAAAAVVTALTLAAVRLTPRLPFLLAGWLWFLIALIPVGGIVPTGYSWIADRFTLLPHLGLSLAVAGGAAPLFASGRGASRRGAFLLAVALLAASAASTRAQLSVWRDSESLWRRSVEISPDNPECQFALADAVAARGDYPAAVAGFERTLRLAPDHGEANLRMGQALLRTERRREALPYLRRAVELTPGSVKARLALAGALGLAGDFEASFEEYGQALALDPRNRDANFNMGLALELSGRRKAALVFYRRALSIDPGDLEARGKLEALPAAETEAP